MAGRGSLSSAISGTVEDNARVQGHDPFRRGQQRVDVDLPDPRLLHNHLAEPHHEFFEASQINRLASADSLQRREYPRLLHHPARQGGIQRRQGERAVFENFHQLTTGAE